MNNNIKPILPNILLDYKKGKICLQHAITLLNEHYCVKTVVEPIVFKPLEKQERFRCEFKSVCELKVCDSKCLRKMRTDYIIFKENKNKNDEDDE